MAQTEQALFKKGDYRTKQVSASDAGGALTAGDVLVVGDLVCIVHTSYSSDDQSDGKVAEVAIGGGTYSCLKATTSGSALATVGTKVYWDDTAKVATATSGGNTYLGKVASGAGDDDMTVLVRLEQ